MKAFLLCALVFASTTAIADPASVQPKPRPPSVEDLQRQIAVLTAELAAAKNQRNSITQAYQDQLLFDAGVAASQPIKPGS